MVIATHHFKTKRTELSFGKKKALVKGKGIDNFTGELTCLMGDEMPWKLTLGHNAADR